LQHMANEEVGRYGLALGFVRAPGPPGGEGRGANVTAGESVCTVTGHVCMNAVGVCEPTPYVCVFT
jgi:hypothetical protein